MNSIARDMLIAVSFNSRITFNLNLNLNNEFKSILTAKKSSHPLILRRGEKKTRPKRFWNINLHFNF